MRCKARNRAAVACGLLALVFTGFSARLIHIQLVKHDEYSARAAGKHSIRQAIPARRGLIVDRNGEILAASVPVRRVVIDGSHVRDPARLASVAAPFLGMDEAQLAEALRTKSKHKILEHKLPEDRALALAKTLDAQGLRGIYLEPNTIRTYPNGPTLSHVLGFLGRRNPEDVGVVGVEGIERSMEAELCGEDGFRHIKRDRAGREIVIYRGQEQLPRHGHTVELAIDMGLQTILETELDHAFNELKPGTAVAVMVDPKTGDVLAMASRPGFDPNMLQATGAEGMKNRAILDMVEPGSTFKIVVAAAALNERVVNEKSQIFCEHGRFAYAGRTLRDHHGYGMMTVHDILVKSSNIGSAKMALMLGDEKFHEYVRRFGFGEPTGVALPGEIRGLVHPPHRWDKLTITRMPMGHSIAVTPLQITMAMAAIANKGTLMAPRIVRSVKNEDGDVVRKHDPVCVRQVVPEHVAAFVGKALANVTADGGTAKLAGVAGFSVAGKTGTAQKVDPKGGYTPGKYVVSFVGYMPAEDPAFVCLVLIDDAKIAPGLNYGGLVAAPIFSRIGEKAARYLDLTPALKAEPVSPVVVNTRP